MEITIVADDQSLVKRMVDALRETPGVSGTLRACSYEAFTGVAPTAASHAPSIVFFCGTTFQEDEMSNLRECCARCGERAKVVGIGPLLSPQRTLEIIRVGACDYLNIQDQQELRTAIASLMRRLSAGRSTGAAMGKTICVLSACGGAGATFIACNIAAALALRSGSCGLLDLHLRGGDAAQLFNVAPRYTMASLVGKAENLDAAMFEQALIKHDCGVQLLAGPEPFSDYREITPKLVQKILQVARCMFSHVVVDLEDTVLAEQIRSLGASDRIVIALRPDFVSVSRTKKYLDVLSRTKIAEEQIVLVANRTGQVREVPRAYMEQLLRRRINQFVPNCPDEVNMAYNLGVPLVISKPASSVAKCIDEILDCGPESPAAHGKPAPSARGTLKRWWRGAFGMFRSIDRQAALSGATL